MMSMLSPDQFGDERIQRKDADSPYKIAPGFGPPKNKPQQGTLFSGGPRIGSQHRAIPGIMHSADINSWYGNREVHYGQHATDASPQDLRHGFSRDMFGSSQGLGLGTGVYYTPDDAENQDLHNTMYAENLKHNYQVAAAPRGLGQLEVDSNPNPKKLPSHMGIGDDSADTNDVMNRDKIYSEASNVRQERGLGPMTMRKFHGDADPDLSHALSKAQFGSLKVNDLGIENHPEDPDSPRSLGGSEGIHGSQTVVFHPEDVKIMDENAPDVSSPLMRRQRRRMRKRGE